MTYKILIYNHSDSMCYEPIVEGNIELKTERKGVPGQLDFNIVDDGNIKIEEGNSVSFIIGEANLFFGFIFTLKRNKDNIISITCYDQLRYLKNKDTYVYSNKTATELIKMIADDFELKCGDLEDTGYKIASRVEDNVTLMDMINNALDLTLQNKGEMYVMYDDFGKICLKNISSMVTPILIDKDTASDYDYSSSIDNDTYNRVKLTKENKDTGKRDIYITEHGENINKWGILQYTDTLEDGENGKAKADALLSLYNNKSKSLSINDALGDIRVRGGSMVVVNMDLGDMAINNNLMIVEKCTHKFSHNEHLMDLTLRGGEINNV